MKLGRCAIEAKMTMEDGMYMRYHDQDSKQIAKTPLIGDVEVFWIVWKMIIHM